MIIGKNELIRLLRGENVKYINGEIIELSDSLKYVLGESIEDINDLIVQMIGVKHE